MRPLRRFRWFADSRNLPLNRQLILATIGFCAAFTLVLTFFASAPATAREQGGKTNAKEGKLLFHLEMKSLDGQKILLKIRKSGKLRTTRSIIAIRVVGFRTRSLKPINVIISSTPRSRSTRMPNAKPG